MHGKIYLSSGMAAALVVLSIAALAGSGKGHPPAGMQIGNHEPVYKNAGIITGMQKTDGSACEAEESSSLSPEVILDEDDKYMLAKIAMAEAEGEDTQGKALVMSVVMNRVHSNKFPDTIYGVIHQKGQFSPVGDGRYYSSEPDADCMAALGLVTGGWDESRGALYFESSSNSSWHRRHLKFLFRHGRHMFYAESK